MSRSIIDSSLIPMISPLIKFFLDWVCTILSEITKCLVVGNNWWCKYMLYVWIWISWYKNWIGRYIVHDNSKSFFLRFRLFALQLWNWQLNEDEFYTSRSSPFPSLTHDECYLADGRKKDHLNNFDLFAGVPNPSNKATFSLGKAWPHKFMPMW